MDLFAREVSALLKAIREEKRRLAWERFVREMVEVMLERSHQKGSIGEDGERDGR